MKKFIITLFIILFCATRTVAENINIAFTIDNNYPIFTLIVIDSILMNNVSGSDYTFYIVENNLTKLNKLKMEKYVKSKKQNIEFIHVDTYKIDHGKNLYEFSNRITPIAFARILLPDLLPKDVHKVLYMDADTLVTTDIKKLYDINLGIYPAGMVLCIAQNNGALGLYKFKHGYYNSGIILMNLDKWREQKISNKMINFVRQNEKKFEISGSKEDSYWKYPDQDVINIVLDGKIKKLNPRWNNQCINGVTFSDEWEGGILHYIGIYKPWDFVQQDYSYVNTYTKFWEESPFAIYRYYYAFVNTKKRFIIIKNKKIRRYKNFIKKIIKSRKNTPIGEFFYVTKEITR